MVDLAACDYFMCVNGRARHPDTAGVVCSHCCGRGYKLPTSGFYLVHVLEYDEDQRVRAVRVENNLAEFTGDEDDLSETRQVVWLRKVAELDGSATA